MTEAHDTYSLLGAFVDELARCGMRDACTSPGSRCTPLVLSLTNDERLRCHSHVDERCAGFFALGLAKASALPVAIACTSGTAVAELLPAVVEAHEARVPLIVLSADRPPELREVGAGQTIDQLKIFGGFAKWFFEVGTHEATPARLRWMRTLACRAYWTALEGRPGAVHLNFPLREPLVCEQVPPPAGEGRPGGVPFLQRSGSGVYTGPRAGRREDHVEAGERSEEAQALALREAIELHQAIGGARHGVLVAGRHERDTPFGRAAATASTALGWPLLADPMSGARRGETAVAHYDALLREPEFARSHRPEVVLRVGDLPVSKPLRTWLGDLAGARQIALDPEGDLQDPAGVVSMVLSAEPAATLSALACLLEGSSATAPASGAGHEEAGGDRDWLGSWRTADELAAEAILGVLGASGCREPSVAAELGVLLPHEATLFVASSMPVRDIETFWPVRPDPPRVLCNRGANGIDGTVSSALGAAAAGRGPVVLLIGDVALAHDIGGLLAAKRLGLELTIVLLNNEGGGIFDFLPVAGAAIAKDVYAQHIATPTGLDFAQVAGLYGLSHEPVADVAGLRAALERALAARGSTIVEVKTERAANVELHRRVWDAVAGALG
ncbi:MAG: 2-succinyl-5-enolpyruvyl-6-hydroxy-3-cyclohexene-1-carboxylic-acid synthase [Solirubrobacteraceae bacterium]